MAVTENTFTGNGSTTNYSFTFPYLKTTDIKVSVAGTVKSVTSDYTFANATTVQFNTAPANSSAIRIYRDTDTDSPAATFYAGSAIKSQDLNDNFLQNLYTTQESKNKVDTGWQKGDETVISTETWYTTDDTKVASTKAIEGRIDAKIDTALTTDVSGGDGVTIVDNSPGSGQIRIDLDADIATLKDMQSGAATALAALTSTELAILDGATVSTAELNLLDGVTSTTAELNYVDGVTSNVQTQLDAKQPLDAELTELATMGSTTASSLADLTQAEVQILDGATVTTAELNILDGVSASTAELNYVDGVTSNVQTQLDAKQPLDAELTELATMGSDTASALADLTQAEVQILDGATVTTTELNKLDGVTATTDELNKTDGLTSTPTELNILDGATVNTSEINKLDGVTASTTELNIVAGKSFKTSSGTLDTTSDTEIPSSKVIAAHVASSQTAIGGFITIADEVSFPATASMPANGVVVSINNAAGVVVNSSGVSTTGRTTDGTPATVTINNFPSSLNGETLAAGVGLIVTATSTSNTYNYHKLLAAETDVKQLSDDINDFNARYRVASSAPGSSNDEGDLYFDTGANKMKVYNGSAWDDVASVGSFFINTISSSSGTGGGSATFNGSAYRFTLSNPGTAAQQLIVSVNGVIQKPNSGTSQPSEGFAIDGNDIIFSAAPASGADYFIITQGSSVSIGTPSANSVNSSHIIDGSITNADISSSAAIAQSKIAIGGANGLDFSDGTIVKFGTDSDMYIYHENTSHTTRLHAYNDRVIDIGYNQTSSGLKKSFIQCYPSSGQVTISHGGTGKFSTTATGISVTGDVVLSEDIELGNDKNINLGTAFSARHFTSDPSGSGWIAGDQNAFYSNTAKPFRFYNYISGSTTWQPHISMNPSGNVELFHSGSKKLETTSGGVNVTGALTVNGAALSSAPTITATADGAIAADKPCVLKSDGKVAQAALETSSESSGFDIGKTSFIHGSASSSAASETTLRYSADYDTTNKKILQVYNLGSGDDRFYGIVGTVEGSGPSITVSWGTPFLIQSNYVTVAMCIYNPDEKKFLVGGGDSTDSKTKFWHVTLNSAGTATVSSVLSFEKASATDWGPNTDWDGFVPCLNKQNTQLVQIMCSGFATGFGANPPLHLLTINMSGDAPTREGSYNSFPYGGHTLQGDSCVWDPVSNRVVVWFSNKTRAGWSSWGHQAGYATWQVTYDNTNNYWYWNSSTKVEDLIHDSSSTATPYWDCAISYMPTNGCFLTTARKWTGSGNDYDSIARVITIDSSGNITKGSELEYNHNTDDGADYSKSPANRLVVRKDASNVEKAYQVGCQSDSTANSFITTFTISGTGSSASVATAFTTLGWPSGGASTSWTETNNTTGFLVDDSIVFTQNTIAGNSNNAMTIQSGAIWFSGPNADDNSFLGFSDAAYSNGATATIKVVGNTTTQSGLSPATKYYVANDGSLTTTSTDNPYAGKALTATSLLIKG